MTVGRLAVGGGGTALKALPAQAPSRPRTITVGKATGTERRGISTHNVEGGSSVPKEMAIDFYEVLGVHKGADQDEIKRAYRARSRTLHPDVSADPRADSRFQLVSEAYAVLSRPESRRLYDRFGCRGRGQGFERRPAKVYTSNKRGLLQDLESLIASVAGRDPEREPKQVVGSLEVDPYEARVGATRKVEVASDEPCATCNGNGHRKVVSERDSGRFLSLDDCSDCGGSGVAAEKQAVDVPVPPRVRDLDRVPVGPEQVAIVKIVPVRERVVVRTAAFAGLIVALAFLLFLLSL